ncbi:tRNA modification GTPase MnmE [Stieleria neptunia]|uniref:tRNA modification GTPase MnmE n=1 Tax=Stieleria neptunia TaxID=2527979 RepID=A0A518HMA5_9BACT|nr:GTPase [Stieleria neptunia]QDV41907.1 tRNA modification GTPase MnmE [Stieleria neptunia]
MMSLSQNNTLPIPGDESNAQSLSKQTTRCALLTGAGRSAIAVIALWGETADASLTRFFRCNRSRAMDVGQVRYGVWSGRSSDDPSPTDDSSTKPAATAGESIVVVPTAPQHYELHCHGGEAAIDRILDDLSSIGVARVAPHPLDGVPSAGRLSAEDAVDQRLIDEAGEVLTQCTTVKTAAIALDQVRGALCTWRQRSIQLLGDDARRAAEIAAQAQQIAAAGRIGHRLTRPFDVVLAGPPNVGKSSLINAMVGYDRSIIMDFAGTTRDVLDAETVFDGWPLRLRDTAGLHRSDDLIEKQGIDRALDAIATADLVAQVTEPGLQWDHQVLDALGRINASVPIVKVINKSDLSPLEQHDPPTDALATVATTGAGIGNLLQTMVQMLIDDLPPLGRPVPIHPRQWDWVTEIAKLGEQPEQMLACLQRGER